MHVCHGHGDSLSNQFLPTEIRTKVLLPGCPDRSKEKKEWGRVTVILTMHAVHKKPHWVWQSFPWKLKAGSSCHSCVHTHTHTPLQGQWLQLPRQQTDGEPEGQTSSYLAVSPAAHVHVKDDLSVILGTVGPRRAVGEVKKDKSEAPVISKVMDSWTSHHVGGNGKYLFPIDWQVFDTIIWQNTSNTTTPYQSTKDIKLQVTVLQRTVGVTDYWKKKIL